MPSSASHSFRSRGGTSLPPRALTDPGAGPGFRSPWLPPHGGLCRPRTEDLKRFWRGTLARLPARARDRVFVALRSIRAAAGTSLCAPHVKLLEWRPSQWPQDIRVLKMTTSLGGERRQHDVHHSRRQSLFWARAAVAQVSPAAGTSAGFSVVAPSHLGVAPGTGGRPRWLASPWQQRSLY